MDRTEDFEAALRATMEEDRIRAIGQMQGAAVTAGFVLIGVAIGFAAGKAQMWINKKKSTQAITNK